MALFIEVTKMDGDTVAVGVGSITSFFPATDPSDLVNNEKTIINMADGSSLSVEEEYATVKTAINA